MPNLRVRLAQAARLARPGAAARTRLAWIRTGLALMGFGFVVARFGLFLQHLRTQALNAGLTRGSAATSTASPCDPLDARGGLKAY
jgi:uncharacterized membrane protein YidH (DUF202 family)